MVGAFAAYTEIVDKKTTNQELIENYVYEYLAANPEIDTSVGKSKCDVARKIRSMLMEQHREISPLIGKEPDWEQEKIEQVCVFRYGHCAYIFCILIFSKGPKLCRTVYSKVQFLRRSFEEFENSGNRGRTQGHRSCERRSGTDRPGHSEGCKENKEHEHDGKVSFYFLFFI